MEVEMKKWMVILTMVCMFNIQGAKPEVLNPRSGLESIQRRRERALNPILGTDSSREHRSNSIGEEPIHESLADIKRRMSVSEKAPPLPPRSPMRVVGKPKNDYAVFGTLGGRKGGNKLAPRAPAPPPRNHVPKKHEKAAAAAVYKPTDADAYLEPAQTRQLVDGAEEEFARLNLYDNEFDEFVKGVEEEM